MKTKVRKFRRAPPFFQQKGIKISGKWKAVPLDPSLFTDGKMEEMICFEELTDYKLVKSSKELSVAGAKRKRDGDDPEEGKGKKNKKRKKKLQAKKAEAESEDELEEVILGEDDGEQPTAPDDDNAEVTAAPLPKKRQRKKKKAKKIPQAAEEGPATGKPAKRTKNWAVTNAGGKEADVSAWKDLLVPPQVLQALSYLGFSAPTPIQALALPPAIRDKMDILGAAETGSGKTLAFAIPMIHSILEWRKCEECGANEDEEGCDERKTREEEEDEAEDRGDGEADDDDDDEESPAVGCVKIIEDADFNVHRADSTNAAQGSRVRPLLGLVVTPTRELAVQVKHHIDAVAKFTDIRTAIVVGGMAPQKQHRLLNRRPEIVIATPGRLWEMITEKHPHLSDLRRLRCLVIDEADRMVEKGHYAELSQLLEMLAETFHNPKRQTMVFSATLTLVHQAPRRLLSKKNFKRMDKESKLESLMEKVGMKAKPKVIDLSRKQATVETLTECRIHCTTDDKDFYLYYFLLQYPGRTMVFANSIDCIKRLTSLLAILECTPLQLHANMHQKQRLKNLERFAERESCVLLTTDVAARGLDIPNIQHVLHYQVPRTSETYVHRSGRTARASSAGLTLLLIGPDDMVNYKKIFRTLEKNDELPFFPVESKCMMGIKERVSLARQIEKIEYFHSKTKQQNSWLQQAADALEMDIDDDLMGGEADEQEDRSKHKALKFMKKQLKRLLAQPIFRNALKTKYPTKSGELALPAPPLARAETALHTLTNHSAAKKRRKTPR